MRRQGGYMEDGIRITYKKCIENGNKIVTIAVETDFADDRCFCVNSDDSYSIIQDFTIKNFDEIYPKRTSYAKFFVDNDDDIKFLIEKIKKLYQQLWDRNWHEKKKIIFKFKK